MPEGQPRHGVAPHPATRAGTGDEIVSARAFRICPHVRRRAPDGSCGGAGARGACVSSNRLGRNGRRRTGGGHCDGALANVFVLRHLPALRAAYPALRVELRRTDRTLKLSQREADIALRLARPYQLDLRSRRIARLDFGLYASPAWIEQFGSPPRSRATSKLAM